MEWEGGYTLPFPSYLFLLLRYTCVHVWLTVMSNLNQNSVESLHSKKVVILKFDQ